MFKINKTNKSLKDIFSEDFLDDIMGIEISFNHLKSDLIENEDNYELTIEMPGIKKEDINITYEDNYLIISAEKKKSIDKSDVEKNYHHKEILYGSFSRKFYLENIDSDNIKAKLNNGILNVLIQKSKLENTKKLINIE